jgi:sRNA-binding regulator protein Hfq
VFKNPGGIALNADGAEVKGSVFLRNGLSAEGEVRLLGVQIRSNLECDGGTFENPSGDALNTERANVNGSVFLREGFKAEGRVVLVAAKIVGSLDCTSMSAEKMTLDLRNASAGSILDDETSWPEQGKLFLDGFVYERISGGSTDARIRLKWLERQNPFTPMPYCQLAKVLRADGHDRGARRVLIKMERRRRLERDRGLLARLWSWVLRKSIGYGFYPARAISGLLLVTLLGSALYGLGYLGGAMTPTDKEAYATFSLKGRPPAHYQRFNCVIYSLESSFPLVHLGQSEVWGPDPSPKVARETPQLESGWVASTVKTLGAPVIFTLGLIQRAIGAAGMAKMTRAILSWRVPGPGLLRLFHWAQILLGWLLATLFVAGVTGVVRKE